MKKTGHDIIEKWQSYTVFYRDLISATATVLFERLVKPVRAVLDSFVYDVRQQMVARQTRRAMEKYENPKLVVEE